MLRNASAMTAECEALKLGIEYLTVLFPTEVSSFVFQVESTDRTVQYKLNAQSLRLFGLHRDVNDAHRAGANRLQNKQNKVKMEDAPSLLKISKSECPSIWIRLPRHKWLIMIQYGRPSRSSRKDSVRSSFGRTIMGKAI